MGPRTFMMNALKDSAGLLSLSYDECRRYLDTYKKLFPEVVAWQGHIELVVTHERRLTNLLGVYREFHRQITDSYIRDAISWIPQSTVGGITNNACIKLQDFIETNRKAWHLLSNKHDSYMSDVLDEREVPECIEVMRKFMEVSLVGRFGDKYTMRTGISVGKVWAAWDEKKCPNGMKEIK
jgi:DNA polymerase I-like protein with 3'-5' exonuclease and polymerase domains